MKIRVTQNLFVYLHIYTLNNKSGVYLNLNFHSFSLPDERDTFPLGLYIISLICIK